MAWYDNDDTGAFDMGGMGDVDFSDTGAFDIGGMGNLFDMSSTGAFDVGGFGNLIDLSSSGAFDLSGLDLSGLNLGDLTGAFDQGGFGGIDLGGLGDLTGAFDQGGFGGIDLSGLGDLTGAFDQGGFQGIDLGAVGDVGGAFDQGGLGDIAGAFDQGGFGGIDLNTQIDTDPYAGLGYTADEIRQLQEGTYSGPEQTESQIREQVGDDMYEMLYGPYSGLGYSAKDIEQLKAGTYAGQEQTEAQVREQLGEELYNQLYPQGVDKLSSGSYTGLGYTAKEIAELMEGAGGVRDTDWSGVIKTDKNGNITQIGNTKFGKDGKTGTDGKTGGTGKGGDSGLAKTLRDLFGKQDNQMLLALLAGLMSLLGKGKPQVAGYTGGIPKYAATRGGPGQGVSYTRAAGGGLMSLAGGGRATQAPRYLRGGTDGMADKIQTTIDGKQPARLSHGEFVIPADVVSHLGNGNSDAGAEVLHDMMAKVRKARTGNSKQGRQINPRKYTPA